MINQTLLTKILFFAVLFCFGLTGETFAQASQPTPAKRNSPFSPNPKGRTQIASQKAPAAETNKNSEAEKILNIEPAEKKVEPSTDLLEPSKQPHAENVKFESNGEENSSPMKNNADTVKKVGSAPASPTEIYKIGIGDVLFISLQNAPAKASTYFTVLKDGSIDYPLAGEMVSVQGLTTDEIESLLSEKIKLYEKPQVSVKVREHNSHTFTVLGMVEKNGEKMMQREAMPLFVVRAEAIVESRANRVTVKRAGAQTETLDLRDKKNDEFLVLPGDIIEFDSFENAQGVSGQTGFFYIGGEVKDGGQKNFSQGITLTQAILVAGGVKKSNFFKKSNVEKVTIRRKNEAGLLVPTSYDLKAIKEGKEVDPLLQAGDTIEVGN